MSDRVLQVLEETARTRLSRLQPTPDPVGRTTAAVERSRARRRNGAVVATVMSVVLVLTLALTVVPQLTADRRPPAGPDQVFPEVVRTVQLAGHTWPVAGRLARDPGFVAAAEDVVRRVAQTRGLASCLGNEPPRVVFADDLEGVRVVVFLNDHGCWWFASATAGSPATDLTVREPTGFSSATRVGAAVTVPGPDGTEGLLVIAPRDAQAELATLPVLWPSAEREYSPLPLRGGVTIVRLTTERGRTVNPSWLSVSTWTGSDAPLEAIAASLVPAGPPGNPGAYSARLAFLQDIPDEAFRSASLAVELAIENGGFRDEEGPVTVTAVASSPVRDGLVVVVVDVVQRGIRSRAMSAGRTRPQQQVLLSDAAVSDSRPVMTWAWPGIDECSGWLPEGRWLTYSAASTGHRSVQADQQGFIRHLPCADPTFQLQTVIDDRGGVRLLTDPLLSTGGQPLGNRPPE